MDLEELRAFLAVADAESFLTASKAMRISRATLRRRIDQLEARAGALLVDRSRTGVTLTEAGMVLAARGRHMVQEVDALLASVRDAGGEPAGVVSILLPVGLPPQIVVQLVAMAQKRYPRLTYRIEFSDDPMGGLRENVDLAIHFGETSPVGPWVSRELLRMPVRLIASTAYLAQRGTPRSIADLATHDLFAWECPGQDARSWPSLRGEPFAVSPIFVASDGHMIRQFAIQGLGIALVPDANLPEPGVPAEAMATVLPDLVGRQIGLRVIVPAVLIEIPRIKALLDLIQPLLGEMGL